MMQDLGVANTPSQVGFYSGIVVRLLSVLYVGVFVRPCLGQLDREIQLLTFYSMRIGQHVCHQSTFQYLCVGPAVRCVGFSPVSTLCLFTERSRCHWSPTRYSCGCHRRCLCDTHVRLLQHPCRRPHHSLSGCVYLAILVLFATC